MPRSEASLSEARRYADEQDRIAWETARRLRFLWLGMGAERGSITDAAHRYGLVAPSLLYAGQDAAVRSSDTYLARYLSLESGRRVEPLALEPDEFRGVRGTSASPEAAFTAAVSRAAGYSLGLNLGAEEAVKNAGAAIARLVRTEVRVSARAYVAMVIDGREIRGAPKRPRVTGYQRATTSATPCAACMSAAGKTFATSESFRYHPGCGCVAVPVVDKAPQRVPLPSGRELFDRMSRDKQDRIFGEHAAHAIRSGTSSLDDFVKSDGRYFVQAPIKEALQ